MIAIHNTIVSEDLLESFFICDLNICKGACCVEGDLGAPLEKEELKSVKDALPHILPYISAEGIKEIKRQGHYIRDIEGDFSTPTISGRECVYSTYDKNGILKCGFELAWIDGKSAFRKPISCHLYPVRVKKTKDNFLVNYDKWHICDPACRLGTAMKMPLYRFLKEALVRKFGTDWYNALDKIAGEAGKKSP